MEGVNQFNFNEMFIFKQEQQKKNLKNQINKNKTMQITPQAISEVQSLKKGFE